MGRKLRWEEAEELEEHGPFRGFRDLRVWQAGMDLVVAVDELTEAFPGHEVSKQTDRLQRAAVSTPSHIAEAHAREHTKE